MEYGNEKYTNEELKKALIEAKEDWATTFATI